jgi:hypothetical protein
VQQQFSQVYLTSGSCGSCSSGEACLNGTCVVGQQAGTCSDPLPLLAGPLTTVNITGAWMEVQGDTTNGFDSLVPKCNFRSAGRDLVYRFDIPNIGSGTIGFEARTFSVDWPTTVLDTVLYVLNGSCGSSYGLQAACSDDSAPPGRYGSRVALMLTPGTYYVVSITLLSPMSFLFDCFSFTRRPP